MIIRIRQAAAVLKMSAVHAQRLRFFIHPGDKFFFTARNELRHGHCRIISAGHRNTFDHGVHRLHFPFLQKNLGAAHGLRMGAGHHFILQLDVPSFQRFKNQQQRHDFGNAGRRTGSVRILFIDHSSGGCLQQNGRGRCNGNRSAFLRIRLYPRHPYQTYDQHERNDFPRRHLSIHTFHKGNSPLHKFYNTFYVDLEGLFLRRACP